MRPTSESSTQEVLAGLVERVVVFLHSNGVGTARAVRIYKTYGTDAVQVMTENPYRLARDIRGIGFKTADAIAMKLGIEKTAMIRLRAGNSYALTEATDEGHCGLPTDKLIPLAELILTALELELSEGNVIADKVGETACTFLTGLYRAEQSIADRLIRIVNGKLPWRWIDADKAVPWVEERIPRHPTGVGAPATRPAKVDDRSRRPKRSRGKKFLDQRKLPNAGGGSVWALAKKFVLV